jgi:hypothetical protein
MRTATLALSLTTGCSEATVSCVEAFEQEVSDGWSFACVEVDEGEETATVILPGKEGDFLMVPIGGEEEPPSFWATCPPGASSTLCVNKEEEVYISYGEIVDPPEMFDDGRYVCIGTHTY